MKNKKLFAILTLVCFMFTLMPVAAFAAAEVDALALGNALKADGTVKDNYTYAVIVDGKVSSTFNQASMNGGWNWTGDNIAVVPNTVAVNDTLSAKTADYVYTAQEILSVANATIQYSNVVYDATGDDSGVDFRFTGVDGSVDVEVQLLSTTGDLMGIATPVQSVIAGLVNTGNIGGTFKTNGTSDSWNIELVDGYATLTPAEVVLYIAGVEAVVYDVDAASVTANWDDVVAQAMVNGGNIDDATSTFVAAKGDHSVKVGDNVAFELDVEDAAYAPAEGYVYIWAEEVAGKASSALNVVNGVATDIANVVAFYVDDYADVKVSFSRAGEYTVYAALAVEPGNDVDEVKELTKFDCNFSTITVKSSITDPETYLANGDAVDSELGTINVVPNNVFDEERTVQFTTADGAPLKNKTIAIETNSSSIEVNKATAKTNSQGKIEFAVAGSVEGTYEIILSVDGVEWTYAVKVGNTNATYIENVTAPKAPLALYSDIEDEVEFVITDINGNVVTAFDAGMDGINANVDGKYVVLTEAPADSRIESEDLGLAPEAGTGMWVLTGLSNLDAEGKYAVKVILDNGSYATAEFTVKKFDKPVRLIIGAAVDTVELGATIKGSLKYMDKNGVMKDATDAELVVDGYAVAVANGDNFDGSYDFKVKSDEKYVGSVIKATAVSEKYDLVATKEFKVADGAVAIKFADAKAEVNVNNKLEWNVVDGSGNKVALMGGAFDMANIKTDISYVILDKPEGAKVSVSDKTNVGDLIAKGIGQMAITSNKVGTVEVQVVLKAEYAGTTANANQVKYYTGTVEIPVGMDSFEDVVVMSIGSKEIVINSDVKEMLCEAVIKDGRTFVPFRAGLEALGATVDYVDGQVIAEMDGVKVVMEAGKTAYTVNGVAKTADVAPYLNVEASTTMVPARFVADAFGINYDYTTNPDGTVADVIFAN